MNTVAVQYTITATAATLAAIDTAMQAPPVGTTVGVAVPAAVLIAFGLRVSADATAGGVRTVTMQFGPSVTATATTVLVPGGTIGPITVTGAGDDYVVPPIVSFMGGGIGGANIIYSYKKNQDPPAARLPAARAFLNVQGSTILAAGTLYAASPATSICFIGGLPPALFLQDQAGDSPGGGGGQDGATLPAVNGPPYAVNSVSLVNQGLGYSGATVVLFQGQLAAGGHQARAVITSFGPQGQIQGIGLVDPGSGYLGPATIIFSDPTNPPSTVTGIDTVARASANMGAGTPATATYTLNGGGGIATVTIATAGAGYVSPPSIVVFDTTGAGSGAVIVPRMGVGSFVVDYAGFGLATVPTVVLTPFFKSVFPDTSDQKTPFYNFPLKSAIEIATASIVVPGVPVLS